MLKIISWRDRRAEVILPFYLSRQKKYWSLQATSILQILYSPKVPYGYRKPVCETVQTWDGSPPPPIRIFKKWNKKQLKNYSSSSKRITVNHMLLLINKGKPTTTHLVFKILSNWQRTHNSVYFKLFFLFY